MLIDQAAYGNRWRQVNPVAKAVFSICGMVAAFLVTPLWLASILALSIITVTIIGAGVPLRHYLKVSAPALLFLCISSLTLLVSFDSSGMVFTETGRQDAFRVCGRAVLSLTSLLFLAMTTPMTEIITLLRRLKLPETLLEMAVTGYRMLFVLTDSVRQIQAAQAARLGYSSYRNSFRSLGQLVAAVTLQVWQRAKQLDLAAESRCSTGTLQFITPVYADTDRELTFAAIGGASMILLALFIR